MTQIVLAKVEMTGLRDTGELIERDRNWFPKLVACPKAMACMWLAKGKDADVQAANDYADTEGWAVFTYPTSERDPLGKAKAEILERYHEINKAD